MFVVKYDSSLIARHYTKCPIYSVSFFLLSTVGVRYVINPHFFGEEEEKYLSKCHTACKSENWDSNSCNQTLRSTTYTTHSLHLNTLESAIYPFWARRLTPVKVHHSGGSFKVMAFQTSRRNGRKQHSTRFSVQAAAQGGKSQHYQNI